MRFVFVAALWLVAAIIVGASGALQRVRPPGLQLILIALTAALLVGWRFSRSFRQWLKAIGLRALVALHLTRFVGFYFLLLCSRSELPCSFARPAGWGDIVVATLALVLLVCWKFVASKRGWVGGWNALGLLDILLVVANAARHAMANPASMAALVRLPLSLLPTFLVPLIIAGHFLIFVRLSIERQKPIR